MGHWHVKNDALMEAAIRQTNKFGHASLGDLELLVWVINRLGESPVVVQLGAGSGTMSMALLAAKPDARLTSVDINQKELDREAAAIGEHQRVAILDLSSIAGTEYNGEPIDLLVIDADHSYEGVKTDLEIWCKHLNKAGALVFIHDYDGMFAPLRYPGVARACHEFFDQPYSWKNGWSAVWMVN